MLEGVGEPIKVEPAGKPGGRARRGDGDGLKGVLRAVEAKGLHVNRCGAEIDGGDAVFGQARVEGACGEEGSHQAGRYYSNKAKAHAARPSVDALIVASIMLPDEAIHSPSALR